MKKIIYISLLVIVSIVAVVLYSSNYIKTEAQATKDSIENAYGFKISIVMYDGTGEPKRQGKAILVAHPDMFGEITIPTGSGFPSTGAEFSSTPWPGVQQQKPQTTGSGNAQLDHSDPGAAGEYWGENEGHYPQGAQDNPNNDMSGCGEGCDDVFWEEGNIVGTLPNHEKNRPTGQMPKQEFIFRYSTNNRITTYDLAHLRYDEEYSIVERDSSLTETNVNNNNYIRQIVERYTGGTVDGKFKGSRSLIEANFDFKIDDKKIDQYYIQVEVVQRVLREEFVDYGSFSVRLTEDNPIRYIQSNMYELHNHTEDWCSNLPSGSYRKGSKIKDKCTGYYTGKCTKTNDDGEEEEYDCPKCEGTAPWCNATDYQLARDPGTGEYTTRKVYILYGHYAYGYSDIVVSRTITYNSKFMKRAKNTCNSSEGKHCILNDKTGECTEKYEYYIGPNKEKALVGVGSGYKFQLIGNSCNPDYGTYEGIRHFYLEELIDCVDGCKGICNPADSNYKDCVRSAKFLKCAENYCEALIDYDTKGSARNRKKNCMLFNCRYSYGKDPNDSSPNSIYPPNSGEDKRQSLDSCANSTIVATFKNNPAAKSLDFTSRCNLTSDGKYVPTQEAVYVTKCEGDLVTDYDRKDNEEPKNFDARTYVNKICREKVSFEFTDTSSLRITKGSGFEYPVIQRGTKECQYSINLEQWKFDYASCPARDPDKRNRLLYLLDVYNYQIDGTSGTSSPYYKDKFVGSSYGNIDYKNDGYDFTKTSFDTTMEETLTTNGKEKTTYSTDNGIVVINTTTDPSVIEEKQDVKLSALENKTTTKLIVIATDYVDIVENNTITSKAVHRYLTTAPGEVTYGLKKVCVSTDGYATISDAPANGVCYEKRITTQTKSWLEPEYGQNKHYTNFQMKADTNATVETKASVYEEKESSSKYYYDVESCTYKIKSDDRCVLTFDAPSSDKDSNGRYKASSVKAKIHYSIDQSKISQVSIVDNYVETVGEELTITNKNSRSVENHVVYGRILLKNGEEITCPDTIELISNTCGISCTLTKHDDTLYEITTTSSDVTGFYTYTSNHMPPSYSELLATNGSNVYSYMKPVAESLVSPTMPKGRYIKLDKALQKGEMLYGYITRADTSCNAVCDAGNANKGKDCYTEFKPAWADKIENYCSDEANWRTDVNGFKSSGDCYNRCTRVCPNNADPDEFCKSWEEYGFQNIESCKQTCPGTPPASSEYLFRSINVLDPFPNSEESEEPFEKGKREVGANWKYLSGYITDDSEDHTSVTGEYQNQEVEYIIDLTSEDIRRIRNDTDSNLDLASKKNLKAVYAKLERITQGSKEEVTEYRSNFIHNTFSDVFKQILEDTRNEKEA